MVDVVEEDRAKAGMPPIECAIGSVRAIGRAERRRRRAPSPASPPGGDPEAGQGPFDFTKSETVDALAVLAVPCPGVPQTLARCARQTRRFPSPPPAGSRACRFSVVACDSRRTSRPRRSTRASDSTRRGSSPTRACTCSPRRRPARSQIGASRWRTARRAWGALPTRKSDSSSATSAGRASRPTRRTRTL